MGKYLCLVVFSVVSSQVAWAYGGCPNCSALVTLPSQRASELIAAVGIINSMPLDGKVLDVDQNGFARVEIGTDPNFKREVSVCESCNGVKSESPTSFEIATLVRSLSLTREDAFQIRAISATMNFDMPVK